jgi:hypothetical protein
MENEQYYQIAKKESKGGGRTIRRDSVGESGRYHQVARYMAQSQRCRDPVNVLILSIELNILIWRWRASLGMLSQQSQK